jgi:hypothetical protein
MCSGANEVRKEKKMSRLIDANALYEKMIEEYKKHYACTGTGYDFTIAMNMVQQQPTIEAVPVVHGCNNNQNYHEVDEFRCSVCGLHLEDWSRRICDEDTGDEFFVEYVLKYCPECGAKMDGRGKE